MQREFDVATGLLEEEASSGAPANGKQQAKAQVGQGRSSQGKTDMTRLEAALQKKGKKARKKKSQEKQRLSKNA